jgi:heme exporter protein C
MTASPNPPPAAPAGAARPGVDWLMLLAVLAVGAAYVRAIWFTPPELLQGYAQKIMYVHVPAAWVAFLSFGLTALAGGFWLFLRDARLDRFAESSAEVGVVFTTVVLITGPIWARPIWGAWWQWDARLTLTLFLWFLFLGYMVLRGAIQERDARARYAAIVGILGALLIPFIHLSVYLFNTMHPKPIVANTDGIQMPPVMVRTFFLALFAFTLLYVAFVRQRYAIATERDALEDATHA